MSSPSGYASLAKICWGLRDTGHACRPVVENVDGYIMIRLNLTEPASPFLRPELLHCTLVRWRWSVDGLGSLVSEARLDGLVSEALETSLNTLGGWPTHLHLAQAPWKKSWTFGFSPLWQSILEALRHTALVTIYRLDAQAGVRDARELHMSWN